MKRTHSGATLGILSVAGLLILADGFRQLQGSGLSSEAFRGLVLGVFFTGLAVQRFRKETS